MSARCACAARTRADYPEDQWDLPMCPGVLVLYPSGRRACDCGEHVIEPPS